VNASDLDERLANFLSDPAVRRDPYPFYRALREQDPVHQAPDGIWWVTNYEGCLHLIRDRRWTHQNPATLNENPEPAGRARKMVGRMILFRDPPDHTRLRTLLGRGFMRIAAEEKREQFRAHILEILEHAAAKGLIDFREQVARLIPIYMICDVLGLPQAHYEDLVRWANQYASMLSVAITPEMEHEADAGFAEFVEYLTPILDGCRRSPKDDLLSAWVQAEDKGVLQPNEVASFCLFTFTGGQMTTTLLMTNALYTLLRFPDQWQRLIADPSLKESAVEEILRFESSSRSFVPRWAREDIELCGRTIRAGEMVIGLESAANRDPARFTDPDTFDIGRKDNLHIGFGGGLHVCPGQFVARVETQELLAAIAQRYPATVIEGKFDWLSDWIVRGLDSLPVRLLKAEASEPRAA
jgi:cytochrome P450